MVVGRSTAKHQTDLHVANKVINLGLDSSVWLLAGQEQGQDDGWDLTEEPSAGKLC